MDHKAGYVNIIGKPNVGKSTLMNDLVGEKISIITSKAQTTRHRILGIVNGDDFQIVFSDTPGIIKNPAYKMHEIMNQYINVAFIDADERPGGRENKHHHVEGADHTAPHPGHSERR